MQALRLVSEGVTESLIRPQVAEDIDPERRVDWAGRRHPAPVGVMFVMRNFPWLFAAFEKEIPGEYWSQDVGGDGYEVAVVACQCGETPSVEFGQLQRCPGCERTFWFTGTAVRVAYTPDEPEGDPPTPASS